MAELVGGALLSGFLRVLFERMTSKEIIEFFKGKKAIPKLLKELKIRLISADVLLNDAEERQLRDQNVTYWLEELKDVIYEADHVIDKINTEALRCEIEEGGQSSSLTTTKCLTCLPVQSCLFHRAVKAELEEILASLKLLLEQSDHLGLKKGVKRSSTIERSLAPLVEESDVYGRDVEKKSLIELLLSDDVSLPKISVIPIVGMGGIGKTTLAQVVYNDTRVQKHFDFKAWLTVSEEFDVSRLMKVIFESISSKKCDLEDPHEIQRELNEALKGKKFLFVHDDMWNEKYELWDLLRSSFESGARGSKIIVTTRSDIVASLVGNVKPFRLHGISEDDCWMLFTKYVFDNVDCDAYSDFKEIGVEFIKKCKGLPLAVKSIAGLLRTMMSVHKWRGILESDIWKMEFHSTNILPALWLSYSFLPPHLKHCFSFLSIFPKDYEFGNEDRKKLILMWMAEGLVQPQYNRRVEDVGEDYLNVLISRSFFQDSRWSGNIVMHDLVHDLALFVTTGLRSGSSKTRYLSLQETSKDLTKLEKSLDTTFLRTLIVKTDLSESKVLSELVLSRGGCLRGLSLFKSSIKELPQSIGGLKHLRYLDLSETRVEELPDSLCLLYNLQTLLLTGCRELACLPAKMSRLINLRHLNIEETPLLKKMPPNMCNMKDIQALSSYVVGENHSSRFKDLGELQLLRGSLSLKRLENVITVEDALGANMKNKKYLDKICFEWEWDNVTTEDAEKETMVLNALEPHLGIKEVNVKGFRGTKFPNWVAEECFRNTVKVFVSECRNCCSLPPFGQLPSLKILIIEGIKEVVSIGDEFSGTNPFPSLEILTIKKMCSWEKWSFSGAVQVVFPRLKELRIEECDKLKVGLPIGSALPALEIIDIEECKTMESVFPIETTCWSSSLKSLSLESCIILESFCPSRMGFPCTSLRELYVWECPELMLKRHSWGLQTLSSLRILCLSGILEEYSFPEEGMLPTGLEELWISDCEELKGLNDKGFQNLTSLSELWIWDCKQIYHLPVEGLPLSLNEFCIRDCPFLNEQCERGKGHYWPKIQHIPRIFINRQKI